MELTAVLESSIYIPKLMQENSVPRTIPVEIT